MKVTAVIPAYQEGARISKTVLAVLPYVDEIIVIDDGSEDETRLNAWREGAVVLRHGINRGQGAALRTGNEAALKRGAEIIVHIDADGQHDPISIPQLLIPIQQDTADVVLGSRFLGGEAVGIPWSRKALLNAARTFNAFAVGVPRSVTDPQSGFRAMTAKAVRMIDFKQDKMAHCSEILRLVTRSSLRWQEVPVCVHYSEESLKKGQKPWDAARIAWQLFLGAFVG
ncbi:glycosyltransferase family 2 protein [Patescibacteria group bacterium]|nr:glycosyltransferase family 2 protein [Patescibacteria group bacterium]MBU1034392.1 glycosyltransferase family 2 protein [Patescibacteria group bacterium]MBU1629451.1 glycosyltransferase family 2 protein [Patescibacteria group bacterium]MBU1908017.1 glycosyltransferase family 2 protein [Patescibacteria group bacterium]